MLCSKIVKHLILALKGTTIQKRANTLQYPFLIVVRYCLTWVTVDTSKKIYVDSYLTQIWDLIILSLCGLGIVLPILQTNKDKDEVTSNHR